MSHKSLVPDAVAQYVNETMTRESALQQRLRQETGKLPNARMQLGADQAALLGLMVRLLDVKRAVEVGTFTGYSSLAMALALPAEGRLYACDVNRDWTSVAERYWKEAGVADRVELRIGPGADSLDALLQEHGAGSFDLAFIDADKPSYDTYYEKSLLLVRQGGAVLLDNMLWSGAVADDTVTDPDTVALRTLNHKVRHDERVDAVLITIGDGLLMARKR